jgi:signal peptidase II
MKLIHKVKITKKFIYLLLLSIIIFFIDRVTKIKIVENLNDKVIYVNNYINLDLVWNTGIGFGLLNFDSAGFYNLVTLLVASVILLLFYYLILSDTADKIIFSIMIGGALGNFYDRLTYNAVPDFIDLHYKTFHWFTFNMADIFITLSIIIFIIRGFFIERKI